MNIIVRPLTPDSDPNELADLLDLHKELDQQEIEVAKLSEVNVLDGYTPWFDTIEKCFDDVTVFGAIVDGKVVGFVSCKSVRAFPGRVGLVSYFFVNSRYRRMGVATKLWEHTLEFFNGDVEHRYISLDVYVTNEVAIKFYESIGFTPYIQSMAYEVNKKV